MSRHDSVGSGVALRRLHFALPGHERLLFRRGQPVTGTKGAAFFDGAEARAADGLPGGD